MTKEEEVVQEVEEEVEGARKFREESILVKRCRRWIARVFIPIVFYALIVIAFTVWEISAVRNGWLEMGIILSHVNAVLYMVVLVFIFWPIAKIYIRRLKIEKIIEKIDCCLPGEEEK